MYSYPQQQQHGINPMQYNTRADNGPRSKCDQVVFEAIAKASEIIVTSRCPSLDPSNTAASAAANTTTTSRFNLQLPELAGVRSILQTTKSGGGALHVPLRLDVYYPHDADRRELLERWCLEYSVCGMERFLTREGTITQDPIAQLRLVCKRIVLWLRTLCCSTCLLPAQAFKQDHAPALGFSLYMVSDAGDDVSDLVHNQGFQMQLQPSSVVTPYGELAWKVYYAPKQTVERLLPRPTTSVSFRQHTSASIPIHHHQNNSNGNKKNLSNSQEFQRRSATAFEDAKKMIPQSAPEYGGLANYPPSRFGTTYDASHMKQQQQQQRQGSQYDQQQQQHHHHAMLQRRHSVIGPQASMSPVSSPSQSTTANPPERVLSGLSLMMMMNDEGKEQNERRRAALHQMPPHLVEQQQQAKEGNAAAAAAARQGEYGYAYNNHIPWQAIHPSQTKPTTFDRSPSDVSETTARPISNSPHQHSPWFAAAALASTPPGEAFLGGTASPPFLMPPRNLMSTPPFKPRPVTFLQHHPEEAISTTQQQQQQPKTPTNEKYDYASVVPPLASLDLLHSSPFQYQRQQGGSMLASFSLGATSFMPPDLRHGNASANSMLFSMAPQNDDYLTEDMPFAVDTEPRSGKKETGAAAAASASNYADLAESASVASFARQLKATNRLRLFESSVQRKPDDLVGSLADQLAEFRTFGESLHISADADKTANNDASGSASSLTPISTRS